VKKLAKAVVTAAGIYAAIQKLVSEKIQSFEKNLPVVKEGWVRNPKGVY
jgi:hypothetical protein